MRRCRACHRRGHDRRNCPRPIYPRKRPREQPYVGLDEYILKHLGRVPVTSSVLRERVADDFGYVGERTFLRCLRALRESDRLTAIRIFDGTAWFLYTRKATGRELLSVGQLAT
jgi:hypothetical protein